MLTVSTRVAYNRRVALARFKPFDLPEYVVLGNNGNNPGSRCSTAGVLGAGRTAGLVGERFMSAPDHLVYCGGSIRMKSSAIPCFCMLKKKGPSARQPLKTNLPDHPCRPLFSKSRISVSSFSSPDGPAAATTGFLKRFTCLMSMNRQNAIIKNSMTVLINMP